MSDPTIPPADLPLPADAGISEPTIPKARFDEINARLKKAESDLAKRQAAEQQAQEQAAQQRGEWERLATERLSRAETAEQQATAQQDRITVLEAEMQRQVKTRRQALPDTLRDLMPDGADVLDQFAWLEKAEKAVRQQAPTGTPAGPRGVGQVGRSDTEAQARILAEKRRMLGAL